MPVALAVCTAAAANATTYTPVTFEELVTSADVIFAGEVVDVRPFSLNTREDVDRTAPWASNTGGISAGYALLQGDGNVVYDAQGAGRWASNTVGYPNARLLLQNDGNLVLYASGGQPVWASNQ